jgi:UDP-N-acetylmuramate dehydrogenase
MLSPKKPDMRPIQENVPLHRLTTFCLGGKARFFTEAATGREVAEALEFADERKLPVFLLGGGSNVLFSDNGFSGLVIHLVPGEIEIEGAELTASAGIPFPEVVERAAAAGLAGLERLAGIPGSFGGALRGNAGAFGAEIGDVTRCVTFLSRASGLQQRIGTGNCRFAYRTSLFKSDPDAVILSATLSLAPGHDPAELSRIMAETREKREKKHPQNARCAGSFFMNPVVDDEHLRGEFAKDTGLTPKDERLPAGWLIDQAGLRGKRLGGAQMSPLHPNYLINVGGAKAEDVVMLASLVKTRVRDLFGIQLKEEIQYAGFTLPGIA